MGNICRSPTPRRHAPSRAAGRSRRRDRNRQRGALAPGTWARRATSAAIGGAAAGHALSGEAASFDDRTSRASTMSGARPREPADLVRLAPDAQARAKVHLLREFDRASPPNSDVPIPTMAASTDSSTYSILRGGMPRPARSFAAHAQAWVMAGTAGGGGGARAGQRGSVVVCGVRRRYQQRRRDDAGRWAGGIRQEQLRR